MSSFTAPGLFARGGLADQGIQEALGIDTISPNQVRDTRHSSRPVARGRSKRDHQAKIALLISRLAQVVLPSGEQLLSILNALATQLANNRTSLSVSIGFRLDSLREGSFGR